LTPGALGSNVPRMAAPPTPSPEGTPPRPADPESAQGGAEEALAEVVRAPIGKVGKAVREDVGRLRYFIVSIRTPYVLLGLLVHLAAASLGVLTVFFGGFPDWPMHVGMHVVLLGLVLLYFRAGLRGFRVRRVLYCGFTALMLVFFAWILFDLVPARPEVVSEVELFSEGGTPSLVLRPAAPLLGWVAGLLLVVAVWLVVHMVMVRTRRLR
jgi:hypothetical protein